jgi:WD40 repeat protein
MESVGLRDAGFYKLEKHESAEQVETPKKHHSLIVAISEFHFNSKHYLVTGSCNNQILIWESDISAFVKEFTITGKVTSIAVSQGEYPILVVGNNEGKIFILDYLSGSTVDELTVEKLINFLNPAETQYKTINCLVFVEEYLIISAGTENNILMFCEFDSLSVLKTEQTNDKSKAIKNMILTNDNKYLFTCGIQTEIEIWEVRTQTKVLESMQDQPRNPYLFNHSLRISPDDTVLLCNLTEKLHENGDCSEIRHYEEYDLTEPELKPKIFELGEEVTDMFLLNERKKVSLVKNSIFPGIHPWIVYTDNAFANNFARLLRNYNEVISTNSEGNIIRILLT